MSESPKHSSHENDFEWEISSRREKEHSNAFYITILSATLLLLIFSVWQKDFLFGVFIILSSGTVLFLSAQKPEIFKFKLSNNSLIIGNNDDVYPYNRFSHFDIYEYSPDENELFMVFKEKIRPILRIRVYRSDIEKIKERLATHLPQKETGPSMLDIFSKIIGI